MGKLLDGAKAKIWDIARHARLSRPDLPLRLGIVAYRDKGDEYVTRNLPLTRDIDQAYAFVRKLKAEGGGDGPEHVVQALHEAVQDFGWSGSHSGIRLIYLVGDAPPHLDYPEGPRLDSVLEAAVRQDIVINAVRCGSDEETLSHFRTIATRTRGEALTIEQSGGVRVHATPYDNELARLNAALSATELPYGTAEEMERARRELQELRTAALSVQADRAAYYAANPRDARFGKHDLVDLDDIGSVADSTLPSRLLSMTRSERQAYITHLKDQRRELLAQIRTQSEQRDRYLSDYPEPKAGFDAKVKGTLTAKPQPRPKGPAMEKGKPETL